MSTTKFKIHTETQLQGLIGDLRETFRKHAYVGGSFSDNMPRSENQNYVVHGWYAQIERELREDTPEGIKRFCKLHYGVPIMRAEDETFRELYDTVIKPLPYEKKLLAMGLMPLTSLMNTDQLSRFMKEMQEAYRPRGVFLEFKSDAGITSTPEAARPYRKAA